MNAPTPATLVRTADDYGDLFVECLRPTEGEDMWEWCGKHLATEKGTRWEPRRARLMRHWYRVISARLNRRPDPRDPHAHLVEQIYLNVAGQLAKSTLGRAALGYSWACQPRTSAFYRARKEDLTNDRDNKFWTMVEKTDSLNRLLPTGAAALKSALGAKHWTLGTALHYWRCGNIADDLRSDAVELLVPDEFDTYDEDVGGYGDPIDQMWTRARTFARTRLLLGITTPGVPTGHGHKRQLTGTQERPVIDCLHCGALQALTFRAITLDGGRDLVLVHPTEILSQRLARYACQVNGCLMTATDLHGAIVRMLDADRPWCPGELLTDDANPTGRWKHHADVDAHGRLIAIPPPTAIIRSGQAGSLYSLDETLDTLAAKEAIARQGTPAQLKAHVNNEHAEAYVGTIIDTSSADLVKDAQPETDPYVWGSLNRTAKYLLLVFDQQGNTEADYWFPYIVRAFDQGGESWLVDAGKCKTAEERDQVAARFWDIGGVKRRADKVVMDRANGNAHIQVMLWCAQETSRRILLRGESKLAEGLPWKQIEHKPNERRRTPIPAGVKHYNMAPHLWRDRLWDLVINKQKPAPSTDGDSAAAGLAFTRRTWWLPGNCPDWYANSLTSEEPKLVRVRGRDAYVWAKRLVKALNGTVTERQDNHWWDCEAMALCAADIFGWSKPPPPAPPKDAPPPPLHVTGGFMDGYA
jgi:phage terminase large subunit GpA-like protein